MNLTVEILQDMMADLLKDTPSPSKQSVVFHDGDMYIFTEPAPLFTPLTPPKFTVEFPRVPYLGTYGVISVDPRGACRIVDASTVLDARPIRLSLRTYLTHYGHRMYAAIKRQRRERACR